MPSINMIASRRAEKKRLENNMRRLMAIILVLIAAGLGLGVVFTVRIYGTRDRIGDLDVQLAKLKPTVNEIENYEKATAKLVPKLDLLKDAKKGTLRWYDMLANLSQALPSNTWLTKIATSTDTSSQQKPGAPGAMTVSLNGLSVDQNQVGEAMLRLNEYRDFAEVDLHYTQKAMIGMRQAVEFEVAASLKDDKAKEGSQNVSSKS
jgi:Tfp pilus assembly protein PilN